MLLLPADAQKCLTVTIDGSYRRPSINDKMDDSTTENLYADNDLLKTRLEKPGTTPHVYYIKDGVVKDDITGFDEENPLEFWDWVKKHNIENLK